MAEQSLTEVISERIREIRYHKLGMNQAKLAAELAARGFPYEQTTLSRIERGERELRVSELFAFAAALGVSPIALLLPTDPADDIEVGGDDRWLNGTQLRRWIRGFVPPPGANDRQRRLHYEQLPADEWNAFRVPGVERLVIWVIDRLLPALGYRAMAIEELSVLAESDPEAVAKAVATGENEAKRQTDHADQLLRDIERFVGTIRDEITADAGNVYETPGWGD
jgi:transcriptional regulator with XRE-family HTH domain